MTTLEPPEGNTQARKTAPPRKRYNPIRDMRKSIASQAANQSTNQKKVEAGTELVSEPAMIGCASPPSFLLFNKE